METAGNSEQARERHLACSGSQSQHKFCSCCNLSDASTRSILGKRTIERKALIIPSYYKTIST